MNDSAPSHAADLPAGATIERLDSAMCGQFLDWLLGAQRPTLLQATTAEQSADGPNVAAHSEQGATPAEAATGLVWSLAHCDDGVTWGRYDTDAKVWYLGSQVAPALSPLIRRETLQEVRIFGATGEVLIWRAGSELRGRVLRDAGPPADADDPLRPSDERRILRGDTVRSNSGQGFTHVADRAGAEQVVPWTVTDDDLQERRVRLYLRHYWEQDAENGAVRIAATRLVDVRVERNA